MSGKPRFFKIRPYDADKDFAYVCDSYMHALRRCDGYDSLPTDVFYAAFRSKAEQSTKIFDCSVAYLGGDEDGGRETDYIFGFLQYGWTESGSLVVGFAYVRDLYRRSGVLSALYDFAMGDSKDQPKSVLISFGSNALTDSFMRRHAFMTRVPEFLFLSEEFGKETQDKIIQAAENTVERKKLLYKQRATVPTKNEA